MVKKWRSSVSKGAITRSKARRSYCLSHFGRGLKSNEKWLLCSWGVWGDPPTKEARSTKLDPPLHTNDLGKYRRLCGEKV